MNNGKYYVSVNPDLFGSKFKFHDYEVTEIKYIINNTEKIKKIVNVSKINYRTLTDEKIIISSSEDLLSMTSGNLYLLSNEYL